MTTNRKEAVAAKTAELEAQMMALPENKRRQWLRDQRTKLAWGERQEDLDRLGRKARKTYSRVLRETQCRHTALEAAFAVGEE